MGRQCILKTHENVFSPHRVTLAPQAPQFIKVKSKPQKNDRNALTMEAYGKATYHRLVELIVQASVQIILQSFQSLAYIDVVESL